MNQFRWFIDHIHGMSMGYLSYQLVGDLSIKSTPSKIDLVGESGPFFSCI